MLQRLAQHPIRFFFVTLGLCLGASVAFASALHEILPVGGLWIVAVVTSIVITITIFGLRSQINWLDDATPTMAISAIASLVIMLAGAVILYFFEGPILPIPPGDSEVDGLSTRVANLERQMENLEGDLRRIGLSVAQIQSIQETYVRNGNLTVADLAQLGLNQTQMQQVEAILKASGFITGDEMDRRATEVALKATADAQATETATCYVQPIYRAVYVRFTPKEPEEGEENNYHSVLSQREIVRVIGHNGGNINNTRWWLIELPNEQEDSRKHGWVWSGVVEEMNLSACDNLPQYIR